MRFSRVADIARAIFRREPWWAEFWSGVASVGWCVISILAASTLESRPGLRYLVEIAPGTYWEVAGISLGALQILALLSNHTAARWVAAFLQAWWWCFITRSIMAYDAASPSVALYICFAGINLFSLARLPRRHA